MFLATYFIREETLRELHQNGKDDEIEPNFCNGTRHKELQNG